MEYTSVVWFSVFYVLNHIAKLHYLLLPFYLYTTAALHL